MVKFEDAMTRIKTIKASRKERINPEMARKCGDKLGETYYYTHT